MKTEIGSMSFLETLFDLLENPLYGKILAWNGENIFEIKNIELFQTIVLPRFYENETFESFVSQLFSYRFKRLQETSNLQSFTHPFFNKTNRQLLSMIGENEAIPEIDTTGMSRKQGAAFLEKLFDILEDTTYEDCISWCDDGKSVLVKRVEEFSQIVLPKFYKHNNFQSFVRQLNMYNFNKTSHDANWREFKQPLFRKGKRSLLSLITRKTQQKPTTTDRDRAHSIGSGSTSSEKGSSSPGLSDGNGLLLGSNIQHMVSCDSISTSSKKGSSRSDNNQLNFLQIINDFQSKISRMENRIQVLEKHISSCPHKIENGSCADDEQEPEPSISQSEPSAFSRYREHQEKSVASSRQNSEESDRSSFYSNRSRSISQAEPRKTSPRVTQQLSFDGSYLLGLPSNNRMEGVALQSRNRTISTGYDTFEVSSQTSVSVFGSTGFQGGVDAILTAAATVAQRMSENHSTENQNGRPLKKMKTVTEPLSTTMKEESVSQEGAALSRKISLSAPFEGLTMSKISSIGP